MSARTARIIGTFALVGAVALILTDDWEGALALLIISLGWYVLAGQEGPRTTIGKYAPTEKENDHE